MADDVESRLQALRTKQQDARRRYTRAEAQLDQVRSQKATLLQGLKDQGFGTVDDARNRVHALSSETEDILTQIESEVSGL